MRFLESDDEADAQPDACDAARKECEAVIEAAVAEAHEARQKMQDIVAAYECAPALQRPTLSNSKLAYLICFS